MLAAVSLLLAVAYALWPEANSAAGADTAAGDGTSQAMAGEVGARGPAPGPAASGPGAPAGPSTGLLPRGMDRPVASEAGLLRVEVTRDGAPVPGAAVRLYWQGATDPNTNQTDWRPSG